MGPRLEATPLPSRQPPQAPELSAPSLCRLFGTTGNCAACSKLIPAFEMVMRARDNVYHLDCFACQLCNQRWVVGCHRPDALSRPRCQLLPGLLCCGGRHANMCSLCACCREHVCACVHFMYTWAW